MTDAIGTLGALRAALPDALAKAELSDPADLTLWNVPLAGVSGEGALTKAQEVVLLKFLRARELQVQPALDMLVGTLKWRKAFDVRALKGETFSAQLSALGQIYGRDKGGKPVTYNFYGSIMQEDILANPDVFLRWRVQLMERAIDLLDFENGLETITQVHDYTGASMFMDPRLKATSKKIIQIFQDHYPELLERKFFVGVPTLAEYIFGIMSAFVSQRTRDKFILASMARTRAVLLDYIDVKQLPPKYGGFAAATEAEAEGAAAAAADVQRVTVPAWKTHTLRVPVTRGDTVTYEWATVAYDVAVKAELVHDSTVDNTQAHALSDGGKASVKVSGPSTAFELTFDNTHSFFYEKSVLVRVTVAKEDMAGVD